MGDGMDAGARAAVVAALRAVIGGALPEAVEGVKWNAPNWSVAGHDLVTLNLPPRGPVKVVFHRGARATDSRSGARLVEDDSGRLVWATDQRAHAAFADPEAVEAGADWLARFCRTWVTAVLQYPVISR